ncbi:MAG: LacI family transcriptional regulator [Kiritimatiellales bacterium]|nr:LacI family transcriptional regulator [Kiritimatiellales bacterium]
MAVKLKDVAAVAGVATNTASSILNSRKDSWASEDTKRRVREAAEQLGYTPNRIARGLSLGKTDTIGLIIPDLQNPFYSALVTEIETETIKRNYDLIIEDTRLDFHREMICLDKIANRQIDGLIINPINPDIFKTHLEPMAKSGMPVVVLGEPPKASSLNCIQINLNDGVNATFQHLAKMGHKKIGFILHEKASHQKATPRIARFKQALKKYNLESPEAFLIQCAPTLSGARDAFKALLEVHPKASLPTAFVCLNDLLAIGAMRAASEAGFNVPSDISFVGVDNIPVAEFMPVALTTIAQPIRQMAINAVAAVLDADASASGSKTMLSGQLIIRESTGPAPVR